MSSCNNIYNNTFNIYNRLEPEEDEAELEQSLPLDELDAELDELFSRHILPDPPELSSSALLSFSTENEQEITPTYVPPEPQWTQNPDQSSLLLSSADTEQETVPSNNFEPSFYHALDDSVPRIINNPFLFSQDNPPSAPYTKIVASRASFALKDYILSPHDHQVTPPKSIYIENGQVINTQCRGGALIKTLRNSHCISKRDFVNSIGKLMCIETLESIEEMEDWIGLSPKITATRVALECAREFGVTDYTLFLPQTERSNAPEEKLTPGELMRMLREKGGYKQAELTGLVGDILGRPCLSTTVIRLLERNSSEGKVSFTLATQIAQAYAQIFGLTDYTPLLPRADQPDRPSTSLRTDRKRKRDL
jgi:transcriptional regulator with XRE-family HTH domain